MSASPTATHDLDALLARVERGESLSESELTALAGAPDILGLGMLADAARRRAGGTTATYARVALVDVATVATGVTVPDGAGEVRLTGTPARLDDAVAAVRAVVAAAGTRPVSGLSFVDVARWAGEAGGVAAVLSALRSAGLTRLAEVPLDALEAPDAAVDALVAAQFPQIVLTIQKPAPLAERLPQLLAAGRLCARVPQIRAVAPLPLSLNPLRPTTGYDDVKAVALARLACSTLATIQVDWLRYGPKLAQVALTFGANDLDTVTASDEAPDGRRRAPLEEVRRNIEAAGLVPAERDGRFATAG